MSPVSGEREVPKGWETGNGDPPPDRGPDPEGLACQRPTSTSTSAVQVIHGSGDRAQGVAAPGSGRAERSRCGCVGGPGYLPREDALQGCGVPTLASSPPVRGVPRAALGENKPASVCQALCTGVCEVEAHLRVVEEKPEAWRGQETLSHRGARWKADGTGPALPRTHSTASPSPLFLQGAWPWETSLWDSFPPGESGP